MATDVLILNTGVTDLRRPDFTFADKLVGKGGLAKCKTEDMPNYSQGQLREWIEQGFATAGGPGNTAPGSSRSKRIFSQLCLIAGRKEQIDLR